MRNGRDIDFVVESVNISREKGTAKLSVPFIEVDNFGVLGDAHRGEAGRSVSLLDRSLIDDLVMDSDIIRIASGQMGENVTYRKTGSCIPESGDRIRIGMVILQVTQVGKECHGNSCSIFRELGRCVMPASGLFCSVLQGGVIKPGMKGELMNRMPIA